MEQFIEVKDIKSLKQTSAKDSYTAKPTGKNVALPFSSLLNLNRKDDEDNTNYTKCTKQNQR
mgnify:FL=1